MHTRYLRLVAAGLLGLSLAGFAACGDDDDEPATPTPRAGATASATGNTASAEPARVAIGDNSFSPASITIKSGGKVRWTWGGGNPHSIVGKGPNAGKLPKSQTQTGSGSYEVNFNDAGTYEYECGVHGAAMSGRVVVQ